MGRKACISPPPGTPWTSSFWRAGVCVRAELATCQEVDRALCYPSNVPSSYARGTLHNTLWSRQDTQPCLNLEAVQPIVEPTRYFAMHIVEHTKLPTLDGLTRLIMLFFCRWRRNSGLFKPTHPQRPHARGRRMRKTNARRIWTCRGLYTADL